MVRLQRLHRRYKLLWLSCLIFSIISATVPGIVAAIKIATVQRDVGNKWGLAGYAVVVLCIAGLIVWRALSKKYAHKLPWALSAVIWAWALTAALFVLRNVIDEALLITFVFAIGATVAFVLSCLTDLFETLAAQVREEMKIAKLKE